MRVWRGHHLGFEAPPQNSRVKLLMSISMLEREGKLESSRMGIFTEPFFYGIIKSVSA